MLILTRKVDQGIVIQGNILITVLRVDGDRVRIGVSAPREITVLRQELLAPKGNGEATAVEELSSREKAGNNEGNPRRAEGEH